MLSDLVREHSEAKARAKAEAAEAKASASQHLQELAAAVVADLNTEVSQVFANQQHIDKEIQAMQAALAKQKRTAAKWATSVKKFNQALKEIGDVENWAATLENDMRKVVDAIQIAKRGNSSQQAQQQAHAPAASEQGAQDQQDVPASTA
ncbi:hypothetical protein PTSG_06445 [Salpingoeca rosetta]|uniref:Biogenesis of lysosome-related organelles complex 1 subunit 1 n=1 Tax=Salpingoeca rosetta (strain ATCC 50818 / BSB-021) TaxID=946362 RepID=F2UFU0_SALR5|nr:uncharacterized protein PTSG_06445 [Salpingoeca rosetta]EGD75368.1 hypothetical protein PTSG_06445 [Salpingoeca rosetta]|eukprot:XP_004991825.1 hypothetical protein PTSG_06445 [Salpingoeca rosetta]